MHDSCDGSEPQVHEAPGNPFSRLSSNPPAQTWALGTLLKLWIVDEDILVPSEPNVVF